MYGCLEARSYQQQDLLSVPSANASSHEPLMYSTVHYRHAVCLTAGFPSSFQYHMYPFAIQLKI